MPVDVLIPKVGEATSAVTVTRWFKQVGDWVEEGEPLFEINTEKVLIAIEAHSAGTLIEILAGEGAQVQPLDVAARLAPASEDVPSAAPAQPGAGVAPVRPQAEAVGPRAAEPPIRQPGRGRHRATPRARRLAEELGVDLATVAGTGPGGLISTEDVERAAARPAAAAPPPEPEGAGRPLSAPRQAIARRMTLSKTTVPHFYLLRDVAMTQAARLRDYLGAKYGTRPGYTAILVRACALALGEMPALNANLRGDLVFPRQTIDIGVAVVIPATDGGGEPGLVVPVIRQADRKPLLELDRELAQLVERARGNRLRLADLDPEGHSLVLTNLGAYGVDAFIPIIDPPDPMIVAAGRVAERPWVEGGQLVVRPVVTLTVAADHRVLDGAAAAAYLDRVRELLEYPYALEGKHA